MKKNKLVYFILLLLFVCAFKDYSWGEATNPRDIPFSEETQECIDCHKDYTPGIVEDWLTSRHSKISPENALKKPLLERRISRGNIPEKLTSIAVGCYECHSQNPDLHKDNFDHFGYQINVVVSPNDCRTCHEDEYEEYSNSKKANALGNLQKNPVYHTLVETITSVKEVKGDELVHLSASETAKGETCYSCHGTTVRVNGMKQVSTDLGDIDVPVLTNWPNQGVGRVNPDGSLGACTACHPRHSFSIEIARKPYTCSQCHLQPDVPAWEVYRESKHGNIFLSKGYEWDWNQVPWRVGKDFKAPTCATCHNSLLVSPEGDVIVPRTHDFGARLWVRLFGLIYTHPQPKDGKTYLIKNEKELPLPTTFTGEIASEYLIDEQEGEKRKGEMMKICRSCHSTDWADQHFVQLDETIKETDKMVFNSTQLILKAWEKGIADKSNPFDEAIEQMWIRQWLFYANSVRYGSAMGGPDYSTFKNGWWGLTENLQKMHEYIEGKK
jgi:hypothetical protein